METRYTTSSGFVPTLPGHASRVTRHVSRGFTLVELVVAITLSSVVIAFCAMFIIAPVKSYQAQARRAELVDAADAVLRLVGRDVRAALPNSVRVTTNSGAYALELLAAVDAVRYRESGATLNASQELNFAAADDSFASLSKFDGITRPFTTRSHYLAIYNVGITGADAYSLTNVITPFDTEIKIDDSTTPGEDVITMNPTFRFMYGSPGHRVYLVSGPVTYLCNPAAGTIVRYSGYAITTNQSNRDQAGEFADAASTIVANNITDCRFEYTQGAAQRAGVVALRVTIGKDGESIWLHHQVHVENAP